MGASSSCECDTIDKVVPDASAQNMVVSMANDTTETVFDEQDVRKEVVFGESPELLCDGDQSGKQAQSKLCAVDREGLAQDDEHAQSKPCAVDSEGFAQSGEESQSNPLAVDDEGFAVTLEDQTPDKGSEMTAHLTKQKSMETGRRLGNAYLWLNQAAYAMAALPIGTVLSIVPLYLKEELNVEVSLIGLLMMGGELLGILFMKYAELSSRGFILRRPNDMNLILVAVAVSLGLIPLWSPSWWFMSAAFMMLVQSFNSASKPVVAEAVHRMAVLTGNQPSKAFAKGNQWRRMGNASIGASSPLIYIVNPRLMFFIVTPTLLSFTTAHICFAWKVYKEVRAAIVAAAAEKQRTSRTKNKRGSTVEDITALMNGAMFAQRISAMRSSLRMSVSRSSMMRSSQQSSALPKEQETAARSAEGESLAAGVSWKFWIVKQLVVQAFPIFDAFISRLPFAFMTIAITEGDGGKLVACGILFSYQSARAVSQYIQTCYLGAKICFALTSMALLGYAAMLTMLLTGIGADLWYIPIALTGLAETLPVQQYFLTRLFQVSVDSSEEVKDHVRELVKASHTGTGIGSAVAFFTSSQGYQTFGLQGVAILGLGVATLKLLTEVTISMQLPSASSDTV